MFLEWRFRSDLPLYAQLVEEVVEHKMRYWLNTAEVKQLEEDNLTFQHQLNMDEIVDKCFRLPRENESTSPMSIQHILDVVTSRYKYVKKSHSTEMQISKSLQGKGYRRQHLRSGNYYYTGSEITPDVNVTVNGAAFDADNYTVTYSENTDVGEATVYVVPAEGATSQFFRVEAK